MITELTETPEKVTILNEQPDGTLATEHHDVIICPPPAAAGAKAEIPGGEPKPAGPPKHPQWSRYWWAATFFTLWTEAARVAFRERGAALKLAHLTKYPDSKFDFIAGLVAGSQEGVFNTLRLRFFTAAFQINPPSLCDVAMPEVMVGQIDKPASCVLLSPEKFAAKAADWFAEMIISQAKEETPPPQ